MKKEILQDAGFFIPYNKKLLERSRDLRKNMTVAEKKLWFDVLQNERMNGYKFTRQKILDNFIVDFYCSKLGLIIEVDGDSHDNTEGKDTERTNILEQYKLRVIRYTNDEVLNNISGVYADLENKLKQRKFELNTNPL